MDNSSFFWANLGVLEKIGVWTPFHDKSVNYGFRKKVYDIFKIILIGFCSIHTFVEIAMTTYGFNQLEIDELTVSVAYGIQHFLGIAKAYIMTSRKYEFLELDRRTKSMPLYRKEDSKFLYNLSQTVRISDILGLTYWFAVLTTISCGCMTGIFVTLKNRNEMVKSCQQKYEIYENFILKNQLTYAYDSFNQTGFSREMFKGQDEIQDIQNRLQIFDNKLSAMHVKVPNHDQFECHRPKRVFPYHVWLPFSKYNRYYEIIFALNFLAGFCLVCIILPIDLLVMSFMRYIRFQFYVIRDDLLNLRDYVDDQLSICSSREMNERVIASKMKTRLIEIMKHHLAVFDFFNRADDLFTWALFAQYLGSGAMICGVLFSISSVADDLKSPKIFHVAFFYSGLFIQLYANCFYGSQVVAASERIGPSAYFSNWETVGKYSTRLRPALLLMMQRSIRTCKLTAGKFAAVDLPTFSAVIKASYTYYTVLVDDGSK